VDAPVKLGPELESVLERPAFWIAVPSAAWAVAARGVKVPIGALEVVVRSVEGTAERVLVKKLAVFEADATADPNGSDEEGARLEISLADAVA
jgi:hypothetical protein